MENFKKVKPTTNLRLTIEGALIAVCALLWLCTSNANNAKFFLVLAVLFTIEHVNNIDNNRKLEKIENVEWTEVDERFWDIRRKATVLITIGLIVLAAIIVICGEKEAAEDSQAVSLRERNYAAMSVEDFRDKAISVPYDELKRNPDLYKGKVVVMQLYINQIVSEKTWRAFTYTNGFLLSFDAEEEFVLLDKRKSGVNIIENDVITVYGVYKGTQKMTRISKVVESIPTIEVYKLELNE